MKTLTINIKSYCLVHSDCLMVNEPMWRFKLAQLPWFCKECRGKYCSLCCSVESQMVSNG